MKASSLRAQALYCTEGFVEEGLVRESVGTDDGYDAPVVMLMLEPKHEIAPRREA